MGEFTELEQMLSDFYSECAEAVRLKKPSINDIIRKYAKKVHEHKLVDLFK